MATIHPDHRAIFDAHMHGGEALLWAGRPIGKASDTRFRLPFVSAIVWLVGMCFMVFLVHVPAGFMMLPNPIGILFILFPLVLITLGVILLATSWQNLTRPRYMDYAVTTRRLLWRDRRKPVDLKSRLINQLSSVQRTGEGRGSLVFPEPNSGWFACAVNPYKSAEPDRFVDIADVKSVEALILEQMFKKETP